MNEEITVDGIIPEKEIPESELVGEGPASAELGELEEKRFLLEGEIAMLEGELERRKAETDRAARDYAEFRELFPDADLEKLDSEVRRAVSAGVPLAAAYALYEKRLQKRSENAAIHNSTNRGTAFGSVGKAPEADYFSPDEVRGMTRDEVRANYNKILQSMKNWG